MIELHHGRRVALATVGTGHVFQPGEQRAALGMATTHATVTALGEPRAEAADRYPGFYHALAIGLNLSYSGAMSRPDWMPAEARIVVDTAAENIVGIVDLAAAERLCDLGTITLWRTERGTYLIEDVDGGLRRLQDDWMRVLQQLGQGRYMGVWERLPPDLIGRLREQVTRLIL
jgi:hypothetical protein